MKFGNLNLKTNPRICFCSLLVILSIYFTYEVLCQIHTATYLWQVDSLSKILLSNQRTGCELPRPEDEEARKEKTYKIGMVVIYSEATNGEWDPNLMKMVIQNKEKYAKLHGYHLLNGNPEIDRSRPVAWSKILAVKRYLDHPPASSGGPYDYLFYIDMDAVIMNPEIKLESLISVGGKGSDFIMTEDWNGLNTGVWFVKNTLWSKKFLELAWNQSQLVPPQDPHPPHGKYPFEYEQRSFHYLLNTRVWRDRKTLPRYHGEGVVISGGSLPLPLSQSNSSRSLRSSMGRETRELELEARKVKSSEEMLKHFSLLPQCSMNSYSLHPLDPSYSARQASQVSSAPHLPSCSL
jgi:hypothetical protein